MLGNAFFARHEKGARFLVLMQSKRGEGQRDFDLRQKNLL